MVVSTEGIIVVGTAEGEIGTSLGDLLGDVEGVTVGSDVNTAEGAFESKAEGSTVVSTVGTALSITVGVADGSTVVNSEVGTALGSVENSIVCSTVA